MKLSSLFEVEQTRYEKCLVWKSKEDAEQVKEIAKRRDGADLTVDGAVMYFQDKFTFDHIVYHYSVKTDLSRKPEKKLISELTPEDFHKSV